MAASSKRSSSTRSNGKCDDVCALKCERDEAMNALALRVLSSSSSPFACLDAGQLDALLQRMPAWEYVKDEFLIRMGDPGDDLVVILSGSAQAFIHRNAADRTIVGSFAPGDIVGEIAVLTGEARTADVIAQTNVRALRLAAADFYALAHLHPEIRVLLTNIVADHLGQATFDGLGGKTIRGYQVRRRIARGGMGIVYEAARLDNGDTVALKMMNHRLLYRPGAVQWFRDEADALGRLRHPSIARLYEHFAAYGTQFLVMEYCEGPTLAQVLEECGWLDEDVVRSIVGQLAEALRYIHSRGLIHHDLKPSNVIVGPSGLIKLLDFGLVRPDPTVAVAAEFSSVTSEPALLGTPQYMAPEQFGSGAVDRRIDLYGLACVAYEALAGRPVVRSRDFIEALGEKLRFVLPPPHGIGRGVSQNMHALLVRALDPHPEMRTIDLEALSEWAAPVSLPARGAWAVSDSATTTGDTDPPIA